MSSTSTRTVSMLITDLRTQPASLISTTVGPGPSSSGSTSVRRSTTVSSRCLVHQPTDVAGAQRLEVVGRSSAPGTTAPALTAPSSAIQLEVWFVTAMSKSSQAVRRSLRPTCCDATRPSCFKRLRGHLRPAHHARNHLPGGGSPQPAPTTPAQPRRYTQNAPPDALTRGP
jgi:hypothetical protein